MGDKPGVRFVCPHCGNPLRVARVYAGQRVPCPNPGCRVPVDVPGDDPPAARLRHVAGTDWGDRAYLNMALLRDHDRDRAAVGTDAVSGAA